MSLRYTRSVSLKCDICGKEESYGRTNDMTARVIASHEGWRYAIYLAPEAPATQDARHFAVDACPDCQLPLQLAQLPITLGEKINAPAV